MYNITLICTHHSELGKCNSHELHKIIESISPDVIFLELPQDLFDRLYKGNELPREHEPSEIKSIRKYSPNHSVVHVPVDIDPSQGLSMKEIVYMFNSFKKYEVYKKLEDEQCKMAEQDGFSFLNSNKCAELFDTMRATEISLLQFMMNRNQLSSIHKLFYEEQDKREYEIIKNIYNYSKENKYNQALLLIGSGHRKSILEKIGKYKNQENVNLIWKVYEGD